VVSDSCCELALWGSHSWLRPGFEPDPTAPNSASDGFRTNILHVIPSEVEV